VSGEDSVRKYLRYLENPTSLVDPAAVKKLEAEADRCKDPIDKLKALAALERARSVNADDLEEAFIRDARDWAAREGIPSSAFRSMGVTDELLARAGFDTGRRRGRGRRPAARPGRGRSTSIEAVQAWVLSTKETFTLADVQRSIGGSPATIKKAIDDLASDGRVTNLGPDRQHGGRGRAPYLYRLAS